MEDKLKYIREIEEELGFRNLRFPKNHIQMK